MVFPLHDWLLPKNSDSIVAAGTPASENPSILGTLEPDGRPQRSESEPPGTELPYRESKSQQLVPGEILATRRHRSRGGEKLGHLRRPAISRQKVPIVSRHQMACALGPDEFAALRGDDASPHVGRVQRTVAWVPRSVVAGNTSRTARLVRNDNSAELPLAMRR